MAAALRMFGLADLIREWRARIALLRESVRVEGGFESLYVMSMLEPEFAQRRAQGLELAA